MISYQVYKVMHFVGMFMMFISLGAIFAKMIEGNWQNFQWRKTVLYTHGIALLMVITGGFGLLARLGIKHAHLPGWAIAKFAIWFLFACMVFILVRKNHWAKYFWFAAIVLGFSAAVIVLYKPF